VQFRLDLSLPQPTRFDRRARWTIPPAQRAGRRARTSPAVNRVLRRAPPAVGAELSGPHTGLPPLEQAAADYPHDAINDAFADQASGKVARASLIMS
jgi:hypothetical protein